MSDEQTQKHGQTVISRALRLMENKGYGWSKAMDIAADTMKPTPQKPPTKPK